MATELVTNGDFSSFTFDTGTTHPGSAAGGQAGYNVTLTGWSTGGYNFVFTPATGTSGTNADTTGVNGASGNLQLWGPGNGSANGMTLPPGGGDFVAADGAYEVGALTQTISGLTVGAPYVVSFEWAAAQQSGANFTAPTTENWTVSLGAQSFTTNTVNNPGKGFSGWFAAAYTFTATSTSETLSFLSSGTPNGVPPFSLLADVSVTRVAEPASLALFGIGLAAIGGFRLRRRGTAA